MDWKHYLTDQERADLAKIKADKAAGQRQWKRIYDRCWKRMKAEGAGNG